MLQITVHLWTTPDRSRHFLVPEDADVRAGDLALRTASGRERTVAPDAVAPYEVSEAEAKAWLKGQLEDVLDEAKAGVLGFVGRLREKTAAMREERQRAARDFMAQAAGDAPPDHEPTDSDTPS